MCSFMEVKGDNAGAGTEGDLGIGSTQSTMGATSKP